MRKIVHFELKLSFIFAVLTTFISLDGISQTVVGLDNWFNHETDSKTGKPFHYLWTDTAWSGFSRWGRIFVSKGAKIESVEKPDKRALERLDVYIIVDPDTTSEALMPNYIVTSDIRTITRWVRKGGVLAVMTNDAQNCEFMHLNELMAQFGMYFNHVTLHSVTGSCYESGASSNLPSHSLFKGVSKIFLKEVSDIKLSGNARPILTEKGKVLIAECKFGKGYVFAIGDPWLYNEYLDNDRLPKSFNNRLAAENLTDILLSQIKSK